MALVTANTALEITTIDFSSESDYLNPGTVVTLLDDVGFTSDQGRVYDDVLRVRFFDDANWRDNWCGTGIVFNPTTKAITAGTITGFVGTNFNGTTFAQQFAVEGFSVSAVVLYNALASASSADDLAMVRSFFAGSDTFNLSPEADDVWAWTGNDTLRGYGGHDVLHGDAGNDWLDGGTGIDALYGGAGNDTYVVDNSGDLVTEAAGAGIDMVRSSITWTLGANLENLRLTGAAATGTGNGLANMILGSDGLDTLRGAGGDDTLNGGTGNDSLGGGVGNDSLVGMGGNDTLGGDAGDDTLNGGAGNDRLGGGTGKDRLAGAAGLDDFRFTTAPNSSNVDTIAGFVSADDRISLDNAVFTGLGTATGALGAAAFRLGSAAADASDRLIYQASTGSLWYDADGTGATSKVLVATLGAGTTLTLADLYVI